MPEIVVPAGDLSAALGWVSRAIPARPAAPALAGVLLEERAGSLRLFGQDGQEAAAASVDAVGGDGKFGKRLLSGRLLGDLAKAFPRESVTLAADGSRVVVSCGRAVFRLPTLPLAHYPAVADEPADSDTVSGTLLADAARRVGIAAGRDDALPVLTAMLMLADPAAGTLRFIATDRFRLAFREIPYSPRDPQAQPWRAVVAAREIDGYSRLLAGEEAIRLSAPGEGAHRLGVGAGSRYAAVRLIDGDYPKWEPVLDRFASDKDARFDAVEALAAAKRVSLMSGGSAPLSLTFDPVGELTVSTGSNGNEGSETLPCAWTGDETFSIGFNGTVLAEALAAAGTESVLLQVSEPTRPALLSTQEATGAYRHLLMPLRTA